MIKISDTKNLALLLSYSRALYQMYQHMHWKCSGDNYYGDHLLYQRLYEDLQAELDVIAEKAIGIGDDEFNHLSDSSAASDLLGSLMPGDSSSESFPQIALRAEEKLLEMIEQLVDNGASDGVEDMLQGIASKHEEHVYLLKQRAGKKASAIGTMIRIAYALDNAGLYAEASEMDDIIRIAISKAKLEQWLKDIDEQLEKADGDRTARLHERRREIEKDLKNIKG